MTDIANPPLEFWQTACAATARHALALLRLAGRPTVAGNIVALIASAPRNRAEADDSESRRRSFCRTCLGEAFDWVANRESAEDVAAYYEAQSHFLGTIPALSDGTRRLLEDSFAGIVHGLRLDELGGGRPGLAAVATVQQEDAP